MNKDIELTDREKEVIKNLAKATGNSANLAMIMYMDFAVPSSNEADEMRKQKQILLLQEEIRAKAKADAENAKQAYDNGLGKYTTTSLKRELRRRKGR